MRKISILLAKNNKNELYNLVESLKSTSEFKLVFHTQDGLSALQNIYELKPDIAIIDLVLHTKDGLAVLEKAKTIKHLQTKFIIYTPISDCKLVQMATNFGASYYLLDSVDYVYLKQRIIEIHNHDVNCTPIICPQSNIDQAISELLHSLSIYANLKGYTYIKEAIKISLSNPQQLQSVTKCLYPEIAKKHLTVPSNVEKAIRHTINSFWEKEGAAKVFANNFNFPENRKKPTNTELIRLLVASMKVS